MDKHIVFCTDTGTNVMAVHDATEPSGFLHLHNESIELDLTAVLDFVKESGIEDVNGYNDYGHLDIGGES